MPKKDELVVGTPMQVTVDSRINNGLSVAPALVTMIREDPEEGMRLNLRVFLDTGMDRRYNNIPLVDTKPDNIEMIHPEQVAFWPEA